MPATTRFGAFFRAKRRALGLNLREFCRRNGFEPANISRLERGLVAPSRSKEMLDGFAKALKLSEDSEDWHVFYDLAAAETGTIPLDVVENSAVEDLPTRFRYLRGARRQPWVNAVDLEAWAMHKEARNQFPRLIRRLVHATSNSVERIEFAAGEGGERPGWDGIVRASAGGAFVPDGLSCWELGVGGDAKGKAEEEFRKRTKNSLGVRTTDATFVFVTARRWEGKGEWEAEKNELGKWKAIRVYDADSLEEWIELAPAVDTWFATLLGKKTEGMRDIDEYWANLASITEPKLTPEVFLVSREKEIEALDRWLGVGPRRSDGEKTDALEQPPGPPSALAVEARDPTEAIDFLSAHIERLPDEKRDSISSRIIIVDDRASWSALVDRSDPLILVAGAALPLEAEAVAEAVRKGHRALLCSDRFATGQSDTIRLSRPYVYDLQEVLKRSGFDDEKAEKAALDCGGSLTVLKRRLSRFPATTEPEWSRSDLASSLARLTLVGSWEDTSPGDQTALARIMGREYSEIAELIRQASTLRDPPLFSVRGMWSLTSREDSWTLLRHQLRSEIFDTWEKLAIEVLSADDPQFDHPAGERLWAFRADQLPSYSEALRTGIAETLAIMGSQPKNLKSTLENESNRADRVVRKVLGGTPGWKRWASLGRQLPLLAEAAPHAFLGAFEAELHDSGSDILQLFADSGDRCCSSCMHSGLLWALESLAWSPTYLRRVGLALAEISERDSGTRWSNRPKNTLTEIFLPWMPHTAAGIDDRINVLRKITEKKPIAGWRLLLSLLPSFHGMSRPTQRPKWRDWAANWRAAMTNGDYWRQIQACSERLLEMVDTDADRWAGLVKHIGELTPDVGHAAVEKLIAIDVTKMDVSGRTKIAKELRDKVRLHRSHPDAKWALPQDDVARLEEALKHVEPEDLVARNAWLFASRTQLLEPLGEHWSWEKTQENISRLRQEAISEIFAKDGMAGIVRLAKSVQEPRWVGIELANAGLVPDCLEILPGFLDDQAPGVVDYAKGYAVGCFQKSAWSWVEKLPLATWKGSQVASLAFSLPAGKKTWNLLEGHSEDALEAYWNSVRFYSLKDPADFEYGISVLLRHGRPFTAADVLDMGLYAKVDLSTELLLETLEAAAFAPAREKPTGEAAHCVQHLIQSLQERGTEVDESRLAKLEWAYIDVLDGQPVSAATLHRALASKPEFFAELLSLVFRSRNEPEVPAKQPTEVDKNRAKNAYRLLHSWETIPGSNAETDAIDYGALRSWVERARELCRESGRLELCDLHIGEVLAHAPKEDDGSWPCNAVRDLIEETGGDELSRGFLIGVRNRRGVTMRLPTDGGNLERIEAKRYSNYAEACELEWPKTAEALRRVAASYEADARREDDEAKARRLGR